MQSKLLTQFYQEYNTWLENGAPDKQPFQRNAGLCWNLSMVFEPTKKDADLWEEIKKEMECQFYESGLGQITPFNDLENRYDDEARWYTSHKNEKRIQWVKDHINLGEAK